MSGSWLRRVGLVALREYKHHAKSKGFWITMIAVPVIAVLTAFIPQWFMQNKPARYFAVADQTGEILKSIDEAVARDTARRTLIALREYANQHVPPENRPPLGPLALGDVTSADVSAFVAYGLERTLRELKRAARAGAPAFAPPAPRFVRVDMPAGIDATLAPEALGPLLQPYLKGETVLPGHPGKTLWAAVIVPADFKLTGGAAQVAYWSVNINDQDLPVIINNALTAAAQTALYQNLGITPDDVSKVESTRVSVAAFSPEKQEGGGAITLTDRLNNLVPLALAIMLWMSIFTVGNLLLLGIIEERANKLIEVLLSSVSPLEFMAGKLLGIAGIGLTILTVWIGAGVGILSASSGPAAEAGRAALTLITSGPYVPVLLYFFTTGYLTICSVFLGLGSLANSQQEAQSYLTPLIFLLMAPFFLLVPILEDPNGPIATTLLYIPVYTPFVMMFRIASNPPLTELLFAAGLSFVFTLAVTWLMARLFRNAILRTGQPPRFKELIRLLVRRDAN